MLLLMVGQDSSLYVPRAFFGDTPLLVPVHVLDLLIPKCCNFLGIPSI